MALPINISELIHGKVVEWERLEFKKGYNPQDIIHSVSAFANDINNWGGGYIIIGFEEKNGIPIFPPKGLELESLDAIQGDLINACYKIQPTYLPIIQPYEIDGIHFLVVWCPAGDLRPYSCPSSLGNDGRRQFYIRTGSKTILAQGVNQIRLIELTAKIPFDDRINQEAKLNDLDLGLIREFLQEVGSDLFEESTTIPFPDLCKAMQIARGPIESFRPINAGLLFFNKNPHHFFNRSWIELVIHEDEQGRNFISETFKGPIHKQIRNCLNYLENTVIKKITQKIDGQAESEVIINYPYNAIEEALCNAVYHKNYSDQKPIEIQVLPDRIEILSYPGPLPPITNDDLQQRRIIARDYRNRRIGDFLKELKLTEGKATGVPLIKDEMSKNGNPEPIFYTDTEKTLFLVTLPCHLKYKVSKSVSKSVSKLTDFEIEQISSENTDSNWVLFILEKDISTVKELINKGRVSKSVSRSVSKLIDIIDYVKIEKNREEILAHISLSNHSKNYETYIKPLLDNKFIEMTIPEKPQSSNQKYRLTLKGKKLLDSYFDIQ